MVAKKKDTCLKAVFKEYESFSEESGLVLNATKTEMLCFNNSRTTDYEIDVDYMGASHKLKASEMIKINGILFQQNLERMKDSNVEHVATRMDRHLRSWSGRSLSILGKICILKTFGISQLIYLAQTVSLLEAHFKKINGVLYKFIWNRHYLAAKAPERIRR